MLGVGLCQFKLWLVPMLVCPWMSGPGGSTSLSTHMLDRRNKKRALFVFERERYRGEG